MKIIKKSFLLALTTLIVSMTHLVYSEDWAQKVYLKNEQGEYVMAKEDRVLFVSDKNQATAFIAEEAPRPHGGFVGSIHRAFSHNGKYLYYDLTLRPDRPENLEEQWLAPIHYLYYNQYHSGPAENIITLIAEEIKTASKPLFDEKTNIAT